MSAPLDLRAARGARGRRKKRGWRRGGRAIAGTIWRSLPVSSALGMSLLPPRGERLWTLNAVRVPDGVDEAAVRRRLLDEFVDGDRRRPWAARRPDLARRPDGRGLDAVEVCLLLTRARARAPCRRVIACESASAAVAAAEAAVVARESNSADADRAASRQIAGRRRAPQCSAYGGVHLPHLA